MLKRRVTYGLVWLLGVLGLLMLFQWEAMHTLDFRLAQAMQTTAQPLSKDLVLVDVPRDGGIPAFRQRIGALLTNLASNPNNLPAKVALDIAFQSSVPGDADTVRSGLAALQADGVAVPVFGSMEILKDGQFNPNFQLQHLGALYGLMHGVGHTWFRASSDLLSAWPFYEPCDLGRAGLVSLPVLLADQAGECAQGRLLPRRVPLGLPLQQHQAQQVLAFDTNCPSQWRQYDAPQCLDKPPRLRASTVIVGSVREDRSFAGGPLAAYSGPEVLAWAVDDLRSARAPIIVNSAAIHLAVMLLTSVLAWALFWGLLRWVRCWLLTPWRVAGLAALLALALPAGVVWLLHVLDRDYTQVLLPLLCMVLTLALAAHAQVQASRDTERRRQALRDGDDTAYDVFVSYRHTHREWVFNELKPQIDAIRCADGRSLNVFYDEQGIRLGQNWTQRLALVIHHSRAFLAVLTPDYFEPNAKGVSICRWEMDQALDCHVARAMDILPIYHPSAESRQSIPADLPHLRPIQGIASATPLWRGELRERLHTVFDKRPATPPLVRSSPIPG